MRQIKKIITVILLLCLGITACNGTGKETSEEKKFTDEVTDITQTEPAKGRYIEEIYTLPEEIETVYAIREIQDNSLLMVSDQGIYDSDNGGEAWKYREAQPAVSAEVRESETVWIAGAAISGDGTIFLHIQRFISEHRYYNEPYYAVIDADGAERKITIPLPDVDEFPETTQNTIQTGVFTEDGKLLGHNGMDAIYLIDLADGTVLQSFGSESVYGSIDCFTYLNGALWIKTEQAGLEIYNLGSGSLEDSGNALDDYFKSDPLSAEYYSYWSALMESSSNDEVYVCDQSGLYRYIPGGSEMEFLINGALCSMSNQEYIYWQMTVKEDGSFLMSVSDGEGNQKLLNYRYSEEAATLPGRELTVYSLKDNALTRQAIADFQAANPDYYINLQIGISEESGITVSDAINTLNTSIMAGEGPDILWLDGIPEESYTEKGLLVDLTEVLEEAEKENSLFENLIYSKQTEEGVFAVPTSFYIPVLSGTPSALEKVHDFSSLAAQVKSIRESQKSLKSVIGNLYPYDILTLMLYYTSTSIVTEEGQLDEETLRKAITEAKQLYDYNYDSLAAAEKLGYYPENEDEYIGEVWNRMATTEVEYAYNQKQSMNVGMLLSRDLNDISELIVTNVGFGWTYKPLSDGERTFFVPGNTVGINAKSDNIDISKEFVSYLLSSKMQSKTVGYKDGLPVNADVFRELIEEKQTGDWNGVGVSSGGVLDQDTDEWLEWEYQMRNLTAAEVEQLEEIIRSLNTPVITNSIITSAVLESGNGLMAGTISEEEMTNRIIQKVNLYLAE